MVDAEKRYSAIEKLVLSLIISARKLRPYFQAHTIVIVINLPLRQILYKLDMSERLLRWSLELREFDIISKPRSAVKDQAIADFIAEFVNDSGGDRIPGCPSKKTPTAEEEHVREIYVNSSSNSHGSGARIIIFDPGKMKLCYALQFGFKVEYEAIIAGLRMSKVLGAKKVHIKSNSQMVVS